MKVTCQSCQAKYTIADEKVRGKVAKIRCKKCGTTIIVDGNDPASATAEPAAVAPVADYTQQGASDEQWTVLVADGDQRTLTAAQVAELYASGTVGYETLVWKDGMGDWTAIGQVDALRSVVENGPRPTMTPLEQAASMPSSAPPAPPVAEDPPARQPPAMAARAKTVEPAAARRPGRGGSTDLFGAAAQEDMLTSAADGGANHGSDASDKLTGARNENSVLFSLSALTGGGPSTAPSPERDPASNKADLRALMGSGGAPAKSKIDDIMNLSGGGVYSPGLMSSPALAPPPIDMMTAAAPADSGGSKSKSLLVAIGGGVLVIGAVAVAFITMSSKADSTDKTGGAASAAGETAAPVRAANPSNAPSEAPTEPTGATREPVRQGETAKQPEAPSGESAPVAVAPGSPSPKPEGEKAERVERKAAAAPRADKPAAAAPPAGLSPPPAAAPAAPAPAAPAPAAPAAGGSGDFDRAAALSALSAAATAAQACKKPDGPTGSGRVAVTFANNGTATTANVEGPPFAGTPVGGCVAARFRSVHIPPFGGSVITVRKTFIIN
ncbi:MAG TPA: zinc-ribbon domain-containing protein [Polyangiaceae bacterium]|nr:zinc-ribbon domain-containing protein [Polyangiaceae bacterium]